MASETAILVNITNTAVATMRCTGSEETHAANDVGSTSSQRQ